MPGARVRAVHAEGGDHLAQRVAQLAAGVVALTAVALADVGQQPGQALDLGGQLLAHDLVLGRVHDLAIALLQPGEARVARAQGRRAALVDEQLGHPVQELVAGGPGHRPRRRQLLVPLQDLLHHDVGARRGVAQPVQVALAGRRRPSTWSMRSPSTVPSATRLEDEAVGVGEHRLVLHPQPDQRLDVEEPAVGELLGRRAPVGQPVVLPAQQGVEGVGVAVERVDLGVDRLGHLGRWPHSSASRARSTSLSRWRSTIAAGSVRRRAAAAPNAAARLSSSSDPARAAARASRLVEGARRDRRLVVVVADRERAAVCRLEHQLAGLQHPAVVVAEHRHQHGRRPACARGGSQSMSK